MPATPRTLTPALLGLMGTALFSFSSFFLTYATMVTLALQHGLTAVTGGTILTVMMIAVVMVQPITPWLGRVLGPRFALAVALLTQLAGIVLAWVIPDALIGLSVGGFFSGLGFGMLVVLATAAVPATAAPGRVGRALGFFGAVTSSATAIGAPLGLWLVNTVPLWGFRAIAVGLMLLALPPLLALPGRTPAISAPASASQATTESTTTAHTSSGRMDVVGLASVLGVFVVGMAIFGTVVAFGPAISTAAPALFIATMQGFAVVGRFISGNLMDTRSPAGVYACAIVLVLAGLAVATLAPGNWQLFAGLAVMGVGIGAVQSGSLMLSFQRAGSSGRGSVAWNMSFDIGLGTAGVVGGVGYTYLGAANTYWLYGAGLAVLGALFVLASVRRGRDNPVHQQSAP